MNGVHKASANVHRSRPVKVVLSCNQERIDERKVKFLNIEEDIQGRDLLTFTCPVCKKTHTSFRLG